MNGMKEPEPTLSSACCGGSGSYRPIGQFPVIERIWNRKFNVPIKAGHGFVLIVIRKRIGCYCLWRFRPHNYVLPAFILFWLGDYVAFFEAF